MLDAPARAATRRCRRSCSGCGSPRRSGDAGARHRAALPDPHRAAAAALHRRRGGAALVELFGETPQWGDSLRPFLWTHVVDDGRRRSRATPRSTCRSRAPTTSRCRRPSTCTRSPTARSRSLLLFSGTDVRRRGRRASRSSRCRGTRRPSYRLPVRGVARDDGPLLPEQRLAPREPRDPRRAHPVQGRARPAHLGPGARAAAEGSRGGGAGRGRPIASPPPAPSPTPCSTRATCCTRTGRRRPRTRCAGSSACSSPRAFAEADGSERWPMPHRVRGRPGRSRPARPYASAACRCSTGSVEVAGDGRFVPTVRRRRRPVGAVGRGGRARGRPAGRAPCCRCRRRRTRSSSGCPAARSGEPLRSADGTESRRPGAPPRAGRRRRARRRRVGGRHRCAREGHRGGREHDRLATSRRATRDDALRRVAGRRPHPARRSTTARSSRCSTRPTIARAAVAGCAQRRHLPGARGRRRPA